MKVKAWKQIYHFLSYIKYSVSSKVLFPTSLAIICLNSKNYLQVKVFFTNPTHQEMLPCPYFLDMDCKFSDEKCKFSHGETVSFSSLQEYIEPKFEALTIGSRVLAKRSDNLWYRAVIKRMDEGKCTVNFESNKKDSELEMQDVLPLDDGDNSSTDESEDESAVVSEDVINMSLLNAPGEQALGDWEKYTKVKGILRIGNWDYMWIFCRV